MAMKRQSRQAKSPVQPSASKNNLFLGSLIVLVAIAVGWTFYSQDQTTPVHATARYDVSSVSFGPTIPNKTPTPGIAPRRMAWIPGGEFSMGAQDPPDRDEVGMKATLDSRPIHRVYVDGFYMDATDVTN
jgi:sulfatase modifying factor 1